MKKQAIHLGNGMRIFVFLLILISLDAKAEYYFKNINSDQGLSSNSINAVFRDNRGYLWIGTNTGLNRFDGYNMKIFKQEVSNANSLNNNYVFSVKQDADGMLWVLTKVGYCLFDYNKDNFKNDVSALLHERNIQADFLLNIVCGKKYSAHFVTNHDVVIYNHLTKRNIKVKKTSQKTVFISGCFDSKDNLWLMDGNYQLYKVNTNSGAANPLNPGLKSSVHTRCDLFADQRDNLWITLNSSKLYFYDTKKGKCLNLNEIIPNQPFNVYPIRSVIEDNANKIWVGTDHGGITQIDPFTFKTNVITENEKTEHSLSENAVTTLYSDVEGIVWVGTFKQGVDYYHPLNRRFSTTRIPGSASSNDINCFVEMPNGDLLIGTNGKGLYKYNTVTSKFTQVQYSSASGKDNTIVSLLTDSKGRLWIGTYMDGLYCYMSGRFEHYTTTTNAKGQIQLPDDNIWSLVEDASGNIWIGTMNMGLYRLDEKEMKLIPFENKSNQNACVESAFRDNQNNLWFGTSWGIYIIKPNGKTDQIFEFNKGNDRSSEKNYINSIAQDKKGYYWIATSGGLAILDKKSYKYHFFSAEEGLNNKYVYMVVVDADNQIWISTASGLYMFKVLDYSDLDHLKTTVAHFTKEDGLQDNKFNGKSACITRSNKLLFGGVNGFNLIDPTQLNSQKYISNIVLTNLFVNNKLVGIGDSLNKRIVLKNSLSATPKIVLRYNENTVSIGFAALGFLHPEKYRYEYRLNGLSDSWITIDASNPIATFNNLSRGTYTFDVRVKDYANENNNKVASLKIEILPPFWLSWSAFVLYFLILFAISVFIYRYLVDRATFNLRLNQELQERKHVEEISAMKVKFFTNLSHELRTPVSLIILPIENMLAKNPEQGIKNNLTMVLRNAKRLLFIVNQLLDFRKLEVGEITYHPVSGDIVSFVKDVTLPFMDISQNKNVKLTVRSNVEELYTSFDPNKLERIIFNLLSNAFKFTGNRGSVEVALNYDESKALPISIKVSDTGIGIDKNKIDNIFKPFYQIENQGNISDLGTGIGLSITYEFVRLHNGNIKVESELDKGTTFTIELPMSEDSTPVLKEDLPAEEFVTVFDKTKPNTIEAVTKKQQTVLIVDDNDDFRFYLVENLRGKYNVVDANNGVMAYEKAHRFSPDIIVSDVMMPEMDGFELCEKLKTDVTTSHIPIILLTANTLDEDKITGFEAGADEYITKPFNVGVLQARIRNLLNKKAEQRTLLNEQPGVAISEIHLPSLDEKLLEKVIKYTNEKMADTEFGVEELSKLVGMSSVYLNKKMSALTGKTTSEYVRFIRLRKAAQLLEKSDLSISQVAYEVGYNSPKYFSKYFKDEYGILPSEYRKNYM